ncbi:hypothetical protein C8R46DRAFT_1006666 [Mycena filopes]|nr:hypothetical protein C8R46DRAFT_1006666 [Mycena filopes]
MDGNLSSGVEDSTLTRATGLWFEDCGLIIQAETTLFRVSRDMLAIQSPDMFSLPPPEPADLMYGCPFVFLPDTAEDVTSLLRAIFYYDFFEPYPAEISFPALAGILRMSHKYELDALRTRALIHISALHPTTLDQWGALDLFDPNTTPWLRALQREDGLLAIVVLARQLSINWILPAAFYRSCEFTWERTILLGDLHIDDKVRLVSGSRLLEGPAVTEILSCLWPVDDTEACARERFRARRVAETWREHGADSTANMPLNIWDAKDWEGVGACSRCLTQMKTALRAKRQSLWDKLPEMFGLPGWPELEEMKAKALS